MSDELQKKLRRLRELTGVGPDGKMLPGLAGPSLSRPAGEGRADSSLQRQLSRLRNQRRAGASIPARFSGPEEILLPVPGEVRDTPHGPIFVAIQEFPLDHLHGNYRLGAAGQVVPELLAVFHQCEDLQDLDLKQALFLDLETTGLSGGAGSCAFMAGLGFFQDDSFVVEQPFMADFSQEASLLWLVAQRVKNAVYLVTFNGRCFDVPMLESRLVLSRMQLDLCALPHLDLLYLARRLWRGRFADCRLGTLEARVLGVPREGDIPGSEIPGRFFNFLRNRDPEPILPIFHHNLLDILTLAVLPVHLAGLLEEAEPDADDLPALGRLLHQHGDLERACSFLARALDSELAGAGRRHTMLYLARIHKSHGRFEEAERLWWALVQEEEEFQLEPYEELAKYYEHTTREIDRAMEVVMLAQERIPPGEARDCESLEHRARRLARKALQGRNRVVAVEDQLS